MTTFFDRGRMRELESLERLYQNDEFAFAVVYGRRRVGKSALINEFIKRGGKKAIRFIATEYTDAINLQNFSQRVFAAYPQQSKFGGFPTWETAFEYIAEQAAGEKLVLDIDEYPYLAKANPAISSELQKCIDTVFQDTKILLILCGSSMSFMENQVLGYQSPLYGRRAAQYRIEPLDYYDSAEFFGDACPEDKLLGYAVTGGIPQYLKVISKAANVERGIEEAFFTKDGFLYEEPQNLLKQELREPATYNTIIKAIANGSTKMNEIASKIGEKDGKVAIYIKNLIGLGIIEKTAPMFTDTDRGGIYRIKDGMYRFWHRFVPSVTEMIAAGDGGVYEEDVRPFISDFMGPAFEDICMQYMMRMNIKRRLPFRFTRIGRWWGGNPVTKKETEIDVVASSRDGTKIIVGDCKWRNKMMGLNLYDDLKERAALFPGKEINYYMFSRSGFSQELREEAEKDKKLRLICLDDLFKV